MPLGARLGVIVPFDTVNDREFWRWAPDGVTVHITRTAYHEGAFNVELAEAVANRDEIAFATRSLIKIEPQVVAFACTSSSFVGGLRGERELRDAMLEAGATKAITTSGAMLDALRTLGVRRISLATPYPKPVGDRLVNFVQEAGYEAVSLENRGMWEGSEIGAPCLEIGAPSDDEIVDLARAAVRPEADALFISCIGLGTVELVSRLERLVGKPVLTAIQVTMWAALRAAGARSNITDQSLFRAARTGGSTTARRERCAP